MTKKNYTFVCRYLNKHMKRNEAKTLNIKVVQPVMLRVLSITLLTIAVEQVFEQDITKEHQRLQACGGRFKGSQYTTSGIRFTEYMYYDESYKLGERRALILTDENITRIKWLQSSVVVKIGQRGQREECRM
ncbi:hypothetical protein HW555_014377 [Spodoptera exigua]|uniref:Uncharacterized protein n=1 Tax=Spodoptera exigua TaxID=7107 RepID=A0A835KW34_SPOEX|nr:hypothetical protein HW555_014377 [Spodoptera exigua]